MTMEDFEMARKEKELIQEQLKDFEAKEQEWKSCAHCANEDQKRELHENIELGKQRLNELGNM
jgi:hypothetical protein